MSDPAGEAAATIRVNGREWPWRPGLRLREVLTELAAAERGVAVERNREVVPRAAIDEVVLAAGDEIEVVQLVGDG